MTREMVAVTANDLSRQSRARGAPVVLFTSSRETLIAWLQWNDPTGCHTDALAEIEGVDPYTLETAWDALETVIADS